MKICETDLSYNGEREVAIVQACRHIGNDVYFVDFASSQEPRLQSEAIHYVEVSSTSIDLMGDYGSYICSFASVGNWCGDIYYSFSRDDVEQKIEEWWKKKLGLD